MNKPLTIQKDQYKFSELVRNLNETYQKDPTNGKDWYAEAFTWCQSIAKKYDIHPFKVAGILAALSPLKNWDENKFMVIRFLNGERNLHFRTLVLKAEAIKKTWHSEFTTPAHLKKNILEILNGDKISAFFLNIVDPSSDAVTVDRHVISVATGYEYRVGLSKGQYRTIAEAVRCCAVVLNVPAREFQAVIWSNYRDKFVLNLDCPF